jgi:hypothetical protein
VNKKLVDRLLPKAIEALKETEIAKNGQIKKTFRGQIATFGAALSTGSLLSAVAFFSAKGSSTIERQNLMKAIWKLIGQGNATESSLFNEVQRCIKNNDTTKVMELKENILHAAIALKLAMNLFELVK